MATLRIPVEVSYKFGWIANTPDPNLKYMCRPTTDTLYTSSHITDSVVFQFSKALPADFDSARIDSFKIIMMPTTHRPETSTTYSFVGQALKVKPLISSPYTGGDVENLFEPQLMITPLVSSGFNPVVCCNITAKAQIKAILEKGIGIREKSSFSSTYDQYWTEKAAEASNRPYAELVYSDSNEPPVCTALSPIDSIADGSKPVTFSWSHEQGIGMAQDKYDLQTNNGSAWTTLSSEPTSRQSYTAPENTLPAGDLSWRVRTYIKGGTVASAWSQTAHVIILAPPEAPYITGITSSPRPTVKWQAVGQEAFEAEVLQNNKLVYRSGTAASREQAFTVPVYLENGEYILRLRVTNTYGMASQWASVNFTVDASPPAPLQVEGSTGDGYASITVTGGETFLHLYLLRDGVPIAKAAAGENRDYRCIGTHTYVVRGVDENDLFADSGPLTLTVTLGSYAALAPASSPDDLIRLRYRRGEYITRSGSFRADTTSTFYCGREFPVVEFSGHREKSVELDFVLTEAEFDKLEALVGRKETLCYRTRKGEIFFGVLSSLDYEIDRFGAQVRGFLEVCDYVERIDYDPPAQGVSG